MTLPLPILTLSSVASRLQNLGNVRLESDERLEELLLRNSGYRATLFIGHASSRSSSIKPIAIDRSNDWEIKQCFARLQFITTFTLQIGNPDRARL